MVRTKADGGSVRVAGAKAPRKMSSGSGSSSRSGSSTSSSSGSSKDRYSGGNSYNPQPTPDWQKGISSFFTQSAAPAPSSCASASASSSNSSESNCDPSVSNESPTKSAVPSV